MYVVAGIVTVILVLICIGFFSSENAACDVQPNGPKPKKKRFELYDDLEPNKQWFSDSPIARGEQVVVKICDTYRYRADGIDGVLHADGRYFWRSNSQPGTYRRYDSVFFDDNDTPAIPFREERHLHEYWYLYNGTGATMAVFLQHPPNFSFYYQHPYSGLTITLSALTDTDESFIRAHAAAQAQQKEKRQRQLEEKVVAQKRKEAETIEAERHDRFRTIQARYGDELFAWRNEDTALTRYAREHRGELLSRKDTIDCDYDAFHVEDLDFTDWLRLNHAELYYRVDEVFYYRACAIAQSLPQEELPPQPPRPKLTPEERQAKFERYRDRALERDRIQAEDRMAAVRQKLNLLQQFRDDLDAYELDDDERERLAKEFEDDLFAQPEENFDGNYKQV